MVFPCLPLQKALGRVSWSSREVEAMWSVSRPCWPLKISSWSSARGDRAKWRAPEARGACAFATSNLVPALTRPGSASEAPLALTFSGRSVEFSGFLVDFEWNFRGFEVLLSWIPVSLFAFEACRHRRRAFMSCLRHALANPRRPRFPL